MRILYMNQGGGGQWGAIKYANYDLVLLAESNVLKEGFSLNWESKTNPVMSIQQKDGAGRIITEVTDLDVTAQQVRPMVTFTTKDGIRVVFVHLKSGSVNFATYALEAAIDAVKKKTQFDPKPLILWIGDFNRADGKLMDELGAKTIFSGGGQAWWDLDRAYISGDWKNYEIIASTPAKAGADHDHAAIGFEYCRK
ncbi:MAG: hypothetical protein JSU92_06385 [Deltaproteobacteria bacterium]|nr:MAG: hypothetical protein JSU92_06385 [Deltaproteobacteria bacterium]